MATVAGFAVEALVHGQAPGLGFALSGAVVAGAWLLLGPLLDLSPQERPAQTLPVLCGFLVFFAAMVAVRASPFLTTVNSALCLLLILIIAQIYHNQPLAHLGLISYVAALVAGGIAAVVAPFPFIFQDLPRSRVRTETSGHLFQVFIGILLAVPVLAIFAALFISADAVFAGYVRSLWEWDVRDLLSRLFFSAVLTWLAIGVMRYALAHQLQQVRLNLLFRQEALMLGPLEAITLLMLVNLLFLSFVVVQFAYLFAGFDTMARTGLTHSEYARRGFFELLAVATLVVGLVLAVDWLVKPAADRRIRWVDRLHALLLLLTFVILISAMQRMRLYVGAYGLSELRFYASTCMLWIGGALLWEAFTLLRNRRQHFATGVLVFGFVLVAAINLANPDGLIARLNLRRQPAVDRPPDIAYLVYSLSADAAPVLLAGLDELAPAEQEQLAAGLLWQRQQLSQEQANADWRGYHWGKARALAVLLEAEEQLQGLAE